MTDSLSLNNPLLIYTALAINGVLTLLILWYVYARLRHAGVAVSKLQSDWISAESRFSGMLDQTQQRLQTLPASSNSRTSRRGGLNPEMRNQVTALRKKGLDVPDIARSIGLSEAEVHVLLGMARMTEN